MREDLMFKFFTKSAVPVAKKPVARPGPAGAKPAAVRRPGKVAGAGLLDPMPLPDVQELHDDSAWDEWEHSQMELDSRMGPVSTFDSVKVKDGLPGGTFDLDPFASVRTRKR
jgi:hypothetical protein